MRILIVEDSLGLISVYSSIIKSILNEVKPEESVDVIGVINKDQYDYVKNLNFDLVIFDWNIVGGTSKEIVEDIYDKVKYSVFITGYAMNYDVLSLSKMYNIPVISKPTIELEIKDVLMEAIERLYHVETISKEVA